MSNYGSAINDCGDSCLKEALTQAGHRYLFSPINNRYHCIGLFQLSSRRSLDNTMKEKRPFTVDAILGAEEASDESNTSATSGELATVIMCV